jgi:NitT/TauT family transport system ATP-binding protein
VIDPAIPREGDPDAIRRHAVYLDTVDAIWRGLKQYID